jgi:hypothetical protein
MKKVIIRMEQIRNGQRKVRLLEMLMIFEVRHNKTETQQIG